MDEVLVRFLNELVCEECISEHKYCTLKELILHSGKSPKLLAQFKCIEKFKYILETKMKKDLGWEFVTKKWVEDGLAKKFSDCFSETKTIQTIFDCVMNELT